MKQHGHNALMNYIDDVYSATLIYINQFLLSLLQDLGLQVSQSKLIPPHTEVTCIGMVVNTITRTISIPTEKLQEIQDMCTQWTLKSTCTKRQLQSVLYYTLLCV